MNGSERLEADLVQTLICVEELVRDLKRAESDRAEIQREALLRTANVISARVAYVVSNASSIIQCLSSLTKFLQSACGSVRSIASGMSPAKAADHLEELHKEMAVDLIISDYRRAEELCRNEATELQRAVEGHRATMAADPEPPSHASATTTRLAVEAARDRILGRGEVARGLR